MHDVVAEDEATSRATLHTRERVKPRKMYSLHSGARHPFSPTHLEGCAYGPASPLILHKDQSILHLLSFGYDVKAASVALLLPSSLLLLLLLLLLVPVPRLLSSVPGEKLLHKLRIVRKLRHEGIQRLRSPTGGH